MAKADVLAMKNLPAKTQELVAKETEQILVAWRRTVEEIISIGCSLERIREALPNGLFCAHIKKMLGLNPMQASRFINVHRRFGSSAKSAKVLQSKVSVLYLLATAPDLKKVEHLANGGTVVVSGQRKTISDLSVNDAMKIKKGIKRPQAEELTSSQINKHRARIAHEELGTLAQQIVDWSNFLFQKKSLLEPANKKLLMETLRESKAAIDSCIEVLR